MRRVLIGLFVIGVASMGGVTLLAPDADAHCLTYKRTSSGSTYCASWHPGSEVATNLVTGFGGNICNPGAGEDCGHVINSVFGTVDIGLGCDWNATTNPSARDPRCGIVGTLFCRNPHCDNTKRKGQCGGPDDTEGTPFVTQGSLTAFGAFVQCSKQGKCTLTNEVDPTAEQVQCHTPSFVFDTFTAEIFVGESKFCPGGWTGPNGTGDCCATGDRVSGQCLPGEVQDATIDVDLCTLTSTPNGPAFVCPQVDSQTP